MEECQNCKHDCKGCKRERRDSVLENTGSQKHRVGVIAFRCFEVVERETEEMRIQWKKAL